MNNRSIAATRVALATLGLVPVLGRVPGAAAAAVAPPSAPPAGHVAVLVEENAESLLPLLTNPTGDPGEGHVERVEVFSGRTGVRIVPMQRFHPQIPGWRYRITEKPRKGEYRYVRWAWKADGCVGTMVQFHIETGWSVRYCAGHNDPGWGSKFVADKPPTQWRVVTRDLFADFGECTVTGIAMTAFQGRAAYFDHVYFGRTLQDLDRIDATGLRDRAGREAGAAEVRLAPEVLERLWDELSSVDARKAYRAFWALASDPQRSAPFLKERLARSGAGPDAARLRQWVLDLGHDDVKVRERATERLADHLEAAAGLLRRELEADPPPEARARIELLLRHADAAARGPDAAVKGVRILEYVGALELLKELAAAPETPPAVAAAARESVERLNSAPTAP